MAPSSRFPHQEGHISEEGAFSFMRTWTFKDGDIICDDEVAAVEWEPGMAQFIVDACNEKERREAEMREEPSGDPVIREFISRLRSLIRQAAPLAPICYICGTPQTKEHAALPHGPYGLVDA